MKKELKVSWKKCGTLADIDDSQIKNEKGVFVFVFQGKQNRIIYVGTAIAEGRAFRDEIRTHKGRMKIGGFTILKVGRNTNKNCDFTESDIYDEMKDKSNDSLTMENYFKIQMLKNLIWMPSNDCEDRIVENKKRNVYHGLYYKYDYFIEEWKDYVEEYIKNINVFACPLDKKYAKALETQIQYTLRKKHKLGYYEKARRSQCWLGQEGNKPTAFKIEFEFEELEILNLNTEDAGVLRKMKKEFMKRH